MLSNINLPIPGDIKITSIINEPDNPAGMAATMMVMSGMRTLGNIWPKAPYGKKDL